MKKSPNEKRFLQHLSHWPVNILSLSFTYCIIFMVFAGMKKEKERADLIAFINTAQ